MDNKNTVRNVIVSVITGIIILVLSLISRVLFWNEFGQEFFGIFTFLYSTIALVGILGFGLNGAFKVSLYRPIVKNNKKDLIAAHAAFRKSNYILTFIMFIAAVVLVFFLPSLVSDFEITPTAYLIYFVLFFKIVIERLTEPKSALIEVHLKGYKESLIITFVYVITLLLKILMIFFIPYILYYALILLIGSIIHYVIISIIVRRNYNDILSNKEKLSKNQVAWLKRILKIKVAFAFTASLATNLSNIFVGAQFGMIALAVLTSYEVLLRKVTILSDKFISPITPSIMRFSITADINQKKEMFFFLHIYNILVSLTFLLGFYSVVNQVVILLFNDINTELVTRSLLILMVTRTFLMSNQSVIGMFMGRQGLFIHRQIILMVAGIIRIILLSTLPLFFGIQGIMLAPIVTLLFFNGLLEPCLLFKIGFKLNPIRFLTINYLLFGGFVSLIFLLDTLMLSINNLWISMLVNGTISVMISSFFFLLVFIFSKAFRSKTIFGIRCVISRFKKNGEEENFEEIEEIFLKN